MDKNDEELRESITKLWPLQGPKMHAMLVPPNEGDNVVCDLVYVLSSFCIHYQCRGVQRHTRRLKMRHGNPRGTKIRTLGGDKIYLFVSRENKPIKPFKLH